MKITSILFASVLTASLLVSCETKPKKEKHAEVSIEMKKINDTLLRATITTITDKNGVLNEDVQVIEGTPGEVKAKVEAHKSTVLHDKPHQMHQKTEKKLKFSLEAKSGSTASGMVSLTEKDGQVTLEAHINGLDSGVHAIHIHEKADCSSADGKSAGGHWNPTFQPHGDWGDAAGYHRGDIGNFTADDSGHGMITFSTDQWCIGCDDTVKNLVGRAIIVHQGADDLTSQPSGAAGARVSCAGIIE